MTAPETLAERLARLHQTWREVQEIAEYLEFADVLTDAYSDGELITRAEVARLTAEAVEKEREACARFVDCGCDPAKKAIAANGGNSGDRWRACQEANCGAQDAAAIRARAAQTEKEG